MRRWLALILLSLFPMASVAEEAAWSALASGGHIALIRHARAPGTGDPPGFVLEDCATQRNLSGEGRAAAADLGAMFERKGVPVATVLSSRWCRCLDTARLAFGRAEPFPPLDSFFGHPEREEGQTKALRDWIRAWDGRGTAVLVTHQVNITALTGVVPREGEVLVLARSGDGGIALVGRIGPPASP